ncbi:MAG: hypothetical protein ACLFMV_10310 [Spirochaetaceae bacterium]
MRHSESDGTGRTSSRTRPRPRIPEQLTFSADHLKLPAELRVPERSEAIAVLVSESVDEGRNVVTPQLVDRLHAAGIASLAVKLLSESEERTRAARFDIERIAVRLLEVTRRVWELPRTRGLRIGYVGSEIGAAAAIRAVAALTAEGAEHLIRCVVSREGRLDLVSDHLAAVSVPTLLITGVYGDRGRRRGEKVRARFAGPSALETLGEEDAASGSPDRSRDVAQRVADLTVSWFRRWV